jgi:hypothetical protein
MPDFNSSSTTSIPADIQTTDPTSTQPTGTPASSGSGGDGGSTFFKSMGDFRSQYPTAEKAMLQGIAGTVVNDMKASQDRIDEKNRENREENGGSY